MNKSLFILFSTLLSFPLHGSELTLPNSQSSSQGIETDLATLVRTQLVIGVQNGENYVSTSEPSTTKGDKKFKCNFCGKNFRHKKNLTRHIRTHTGVRPFECSICKSRFNRKGNLTSHIRSVHLNEKRFTCDHCGRQFSRKGNLNVHIKSIHNRKKHCKRKNKSKTTQHQNTLNQFQCSVCNMRFESKDAFASTCTDCRENFLSSLLNTSSSK